MAAVTCKSSDRKAATLKSSFSKLLKNLFEDEI